MAKTQRLELEDHLLARISRSKRPPRRRWPLAALLRWLAVLVVLAGAAWAAGEWVSWRASREIALSETVTRLLEHLADDDFRAAASLCAESPRGRELLESSNAQRLTAAGLGARTGSPEELLEERIRRLAIVRRDAEELGVQWADITPLAFGGAKGLLTAPGITRRPVAAIIGSVYFRSAGRVYRLEVTLRECGGEYVVTEVWQCEPSEAGPSDLRQDSYQNFLRFSLAPTPGGARYQVDDESHVFVPLASGVR